MPRTGEIIKTRWLPVQLRQDKPVTVVRPVPQLRITWFQSLLHYQISLDPGRCPILDKNSRSHVVRYLSENLSNTVLTSTFGSAGTGLLVTILLKIIELMHMYIGVDSRV